MKDTEQSRKVTPDKTNRKPFEEPKLTYVQPKLSKHGEVTRVTQTYFGSFSA